MTTIAVLGARGRLSHAVAKAFHAAGCKVVAVSRNGRVEGLPDDVEHRAADALQRDELIAATRGADIIFNGLNPVYTQWKEKVMPMAENVVAAAKANGAVHLFAGNVYNYGREIPEVADEATPFFRSTRKGSLRIDMEQRFERAARAEGVQTIVLRAGDFFGTEKTGSWFDLVVASKLGKGVVTYPGPVDLPHAWAYLPDLADAFVALAGRREALGRFETFNYAGFTMTGEDLIGHVEAVLGRKVKRAGLPWIAIRAGGIFNGMCREIAEMSYLWFTPHRLSGRKLAASVGDTVRTPPREAVRAALADLGFLESGKGGRNAA